MSESTEQRLPLRDYLVLPLLSLLTAVLFLGSTEFAARTFWPKNTLDSCLMRDSSGLHYKPGCVSKTKIPEGPWVESHYNDCGLQSGFPCRPKPAGDVRVAILGSSSAEGYMVPYEASYGAGLERILSQQCSRTVQVQNLAVAGTHLSDVARRTDEALSLQPDLVLIVITPYDLWKEIAEEPSEEGPSKPSGASAKSFLISKVETLKQWIRESSALLMLRHLLYRDAQTYLDFFLMSSTGGADFLDKSLPPRWQQGFAHLDKLLGDMADKIHAQGVAFAIVPSFHRPQVALMNARTAFPGKDPFTFEREIARIAERHGIEDLEVTGDIQRAAANEELFYLADGHMERKGHRVLAESLSKQILQRQLLKQWGCPASPISNLLAVR
jgi:hypothetical protein